MKTTPTDARNALAEIVAGLDGVTPGKWCQFHPSYCEEAKNATFSSWDTSHDLSTVRDGTRYRIGTFKHASDAAHVDRLDPATIRSISTLVSSQDARIAALEAQVEGMRVALEELLHAYSEPDRRLCCDGRDCGCMGSTVHQQAEHYARAALQSSETTGEK